MESSLKTGASQSLMSKTTLTCGTDMWLNAGSQNIRQWWHVFLNMLRTWPAVPLWRAVFFQTFHFLFGTKIAHYSSLVRWLSFRIFSSGLTRKSRTVPLWRVIFFQNFHTFWQKYDFSTTGIKLSVLRLSIRWVLDATWISKTTTELLFGRIKSKFSRQALYSYLTSWPVIHVYVVNTVGKVVKQNDFGSKFKIKLLIKVLRLF